jgi:hypothetical protein
MHRREAKGGVAPSYKFLPNFDKLWWYCFLKSLPALEACYSPIDFNLTSII